MCTYPLCFVLHVVFLAIYRTKPPPPYLGGRGGGRGGGREGRGGMGWVGGEGGGVGSYTQKAVHTQGGTHKRRSVATAGVMLFKGPQARRCTQKAVHTQGGAHRRRNTQKAVCGHRRSHVI